MARVQINATARPTTTEGFRAEVGRGTDAIEAITAAQSAVTDALANETISGDGTANDLVLAVQTAVDAIATAMTKDIAINFNTSTVTSQSQLEYVFRQMAREVQGMGVV